MDQRKIYPKLKEELLILLLPMMRLMTMLLKAYLVLLKKMNKVNSTKTVLTDLLDNSSIDQEGIATIIIIIIHRRNSYFINSNSEISPIS